VAALAAPAIQSGQLVDQLGYKATHDGLTGLLNRVGFRHCIDRALGSVGAHHEGEERADEDGPAGANRPAGANEPAGANGPAGNAGPAGETRRASDTARAGARHAGGEARVGLLFVDLNEFKQVNDVYGHEAGDELIRQAANRLEETCREGDEVARLGGDEFAIVLADVHHDEQVRAAERRVRDAFVEPFSVTTGLTISVGASVGGGVWPEDGHTATELVRHADAAMYEDKARSRRPSSRGSARRYGAPTPAGAR
jgi:diguanylate cyclase (GGDEF)-like protein